MNRNGTILVIEDDPDDAEILQDVFDIVLREHNYTNKVVILQDSTLVIPYLKQCTTMPFLIISDVNMPKLNGIQLREKIYSDVDLKNIFLPYVFLTTSGYNKANIERAFGIQEHGFFIKPATMEEYIKLIAEILGYWKTSHIPY